MSFIQVDEMDFSEVLNNEFDKGQIVILKFGSEYCDACMALEFELEEIDDAHENVSVLEIDCGESEDLAQKYGGINSFTPPHPEADKTIWSTDHKFGMEVGSDAKSRGVRPSDVRHGRLHSARGIHGP